MLPSCSHTDELIQHRVPYGKHERGAIGTRNEIEGRGYFLMIVFLSRRIRPCLDVARRQCA